MRTNIFVKNNIMKRITLGMNCPDQKGIIAAVTNFIHGNNGNIVYIDQYVDRVNAIFFMRVECEIADNHQGIENFKTNFIDSVGNEFQLKIDIYLNNALQRKDLFVTK